ncbi:MAG: HlyC/CorC family transporter [Bacteroidaceae bacterium]|nr:HlyC/CorC family transporter [Bacteroidaceae bacterium]MBR3757590.1 HlyC/CorC family transporter [Bacteroidaceae bacterium]
MGDIIIQIIITLAFSAFFSGMEIAFVSSNKLRFELEKTNSNITTHILSIFYKRPNDFISSQLVGNNIALVIYGILMAELIEQNLLKGIIENEFLLVLIQTIISTLIVLLTGEFMPKTLFKINPNKTLQLFAIPAFICYIILYPISRFASSLSNGILRIVGIRVNKDTSNIAFTKVDLDYFIQSSIESKSEEDIETEVKIFQNALDFSSIKIRDCIVPRTEIIAVDINASLDELKSHFIESGISKIIVYKESIDNIIGYIHSSEMFRHAESWKEHISQIPFVPETMAAQKLMQLFMQQKKTLAVVVDEFGGTSGIVALEDLVEEILGEIEDEHDTSNYIAKKLSDEEYILSARLEIEKINEMFDLELPESDDYITLGGLILHQYQSFPKLHEIVKFDRFQFKIIKMSATKIELVRLKVVE